MQAHRVAPRGGNHQDIAVHQTRPFVEELPFFAIAAAASLLFLFHGMLYLDGRSPPEFRIEPFLFVTGLSYLFLRSVVLAVEMRRPPAPAARVQCPECGHWIDGSSKGVEAHARRELLAKPSQTRGDPTTALRAAVEVVGIGTRARDTNPVADLPLVPHEAENEMSRDPAAARNDPDFLERARHGPHPPSAKRIQR